MSLCLPDGEEAPSSTLAPAKAAGSATTFPATRQPCNLTFDATRQPSSRQQTCDLTTTACSMPSQGWTISPHHIPARYHMCSTPEHKNKPRKIQFEATP